MEPSTANAFETFLEKASELMESGFTRRLRTGRIVLRVRGADKQVQTDGPTLDEVKSFSTTARLFTLRDGISFRSIAKVTEGDRGLSDLWRTRFGEIRSSLNDHLQQQPMVPMVISEIPLTNEDLLYTWLHGDLTHVDPDKRRTFLILSSAGISNLLFQNGLQDVLLALLQHVQAAAREIEAELRRSCP